MGRRSLMTLWPRGCSLSTWKERRDFCQGALHLLQTQGLRVQNSCPLTLDELLTVGSEAGAHFTVHGS